MQKPTKSRFDFRCLSEGCGQSFPLELTKAEFIDNDVRCPKCGAAAKRIILVNFAPLPSGKTELQRSRTYPYYNTQIPLLPGQKPGEPNVMSRAHENDILAGAIGGQRWERNAI